MRLGYGRFGDEAALRDAGADPVWIDTDDTFPAERDDLLTNGLRHGGVLVLVERGRLGTGREVPRLEAWIADMGATVEILPPPAEPARARPGPAPRFAPDYRQEKRLRHYWHGPFGWREVERQAAQIMGHPVSRNTLNHHLGTRNAPNPWINEPPERGDEKEGHSE